jgi:hypothetical protein
MSRGPEVARAILEIFQKQHSTAGYGLPTQVIVALSARRGWSTDETVSGIVYGCELGWFDKRRSGFLTLGDAGFRDITLQADRP